MSLLGIDIGTTGCKSVVYRVNGQKICQSYREYDIISSKPGYAELDSIDVWNKIRETIREVALQTGSDPIRALSEQWLHITSDILNMPIVKNEVSEAGTLGAAIIAGVGTKVFDSFQEGIKKWFQ